MSSVTSALVTPQMLTWAREEAGYPSVERAAEGIGFPAAKLHAWEQGDALPTLRQAEKLAKKYHRSFSVFLLSQPPQTTLLAAEYRRLPGVIPGAESPELRLAIRTMMRRRNIALELLGDLGDAPPQLTMAVSLSEAVEATAQRLRQSLNIPIDTQLRWNDAYQAWREWRTAVEAIGVLVMQFGGVDINMARGVALFDTPLPVIGVNTQEIPLSRPFTLMHELVHLGLGISSEEKPAIEERRSDEEWATVERFAERVASAILVPESDLQQMLHTMFQDHRRNWDVDGMRLLANRFKVTPTAMATRLLSLGHMNSAAYNRWRADWDKLQRATPPRKSKGFATPVDKALSRNGRAFTSLVLEALSLERISSETASHYLDLNYHHIENLRRRISFGRGDDLEPVVTG